MRRFAIGAALLLAACSQPAEDKGQASDTLPTVATTTTTAATTTTTQPASSRPTTTRPIKLVVGKYCAAMHAAGWTFEQASAYYDRHGQPAHMDADGDGIPCETVYGEQGGTPAPATVDPRWGQTCEQIGHEYAAKPGDPHDGDGDGIACEGY